jgi:hypothetical protein
MDDLASQLVMAVKSLLVGLVEEAAAQAKLPYELNAVAAARMWIANGDAASTLAGKLQTYENAFQALRPALPALNANGGFPIVPVTGGYEAQVASKSNCVVNDVGTGNYSFISITERIRNGNGR